MSNRESLNVTAGISAVDAGGTARSRAYRDKLCGQMLVAAGVVEQGAIEIAMQQRDAGSTTSLAEILVQNGAMKVQVCRAIDTLMESLLADQVAAPETSLSHLSGTATISFAQATPDSTISWIAKHPHIAPVSHQFGDYELLEPIAKGGMGVVYKARQVKLDRLVALKMILAGEFSDDEQVRRFYTEAEAAAKLDHPGIVPVYEVGQANGQHFYSMALVQGKSLNDLVKADGPIPPAQAARLLKVAAEAVHYAHEKGIVHRDIKPHNILLDQNQQPRITDFGLAKRVEAQSELTMTGQVLGTPSYMPPEQARGATEQVGVTSDVYSLGATLYYLLTGRPPFQTSSRTLTLQQVIDNEPVPPRRLDPAIARDLETICLKCLRKEIDKRYSTAAALADDLGRWLENKPIVARRVSHQERVWLWCKRRPAIAGLLAALVLFAAVGSVVFYEGQNAVHAAGLVDALIKADADKVPELIKEMDGYHRWTDPLLRQRFAAAEEGSVEQLFLRLAMVPVDPLHVPQLQEDLLVRETRYLGAIRDQLQGHQGEFVSTLWETLHGKDHSSDRRLRAGVALAAYAPDSKQWTAEDFAFLAERLVSGNVEDQPRLREYMRSIKEELLGDLERIFSDPRATESQQMSAANALADFAETDALRLTRLLTLASPGQYSVLYPLVRPNRETAAQESLRRIAGDDPADGLGHFDRISLGQRRAGAAITLLRHGEPDAALDTLRVDEDPESLTQFVHRCRQRGVLAAELLGCVERVDAIRHTKSGEARRTEDRVLFGLLLTLGEFDLAELPAAERDSLVERLAGWYAHDPSSAIHGATGWLLRHWKQDDRARQVDETPVPYSQEREWYTLAYKAETQDKSDPDLSLHEQTFWMTFIVFPAGEYEIGSREDEPDREAPKELRHTVVLTQPFAILDREITWAELEAFQPLFNVFREQTESTLPESVGSGATWYDAVIFCRWLTERVGMSEDQQAYADPAVLHQQAGAKLESDAVAGGLPRNWPVDLNKPGYRLPTEAEWEIAARAGVQTAFGFGNDASLLRHYGWTQDSGGRPARVPRRLRPNARGLFDMHGNVYEWCHDWFGEYAPGRSGWTGPVEGSNRVVRGGSWDDSSRGCRSAFRNGATPLTRVATMGFRIVTVPAVSESEAECGSR